MSFTSGAALQTLRPCLLTGSFQWRCLVHFGWVAVTVAGEPHKAAGAALGQKVLRHNPADRLAFYLWV